MSYGLEIKTASNHLVLGSAAYNYIELVGAITAISSGTGYVIYSLAYNNDKLPLIFFLFSINDTGVVSNITRTSTGWTFFVWGTVRANTAKIKIFVIQTPATITGYGLKIFDASGNTTFNSNQRPLWISDQFTNEYNPVVQLNGPNYDQINGTFTASSPIFLGNAYWAAVMGPSLFGFKRTGANTWSTTRVNGSASGVNIRYIGLVIADYVA